MAVQINVVGTYNGKELERAQKQLGALSKDVDGSKKRFAGFGSSMKSGFKVAAIGVAAAGAAVAGAGFAMLKFAKAAEEAATANARIEQINNSMNLFGAETAKVTSRIQKFAESQQFVIAQSDEVIKATQAKLLTFKNLAQSADVAGGAFDRATMAAADLAGAGFGQMEQNAVQLGKALQDPVKGITALGRAGVTFTATEKEKIAALVASGDMLAAQDMVLGAIEMQVGGTAKATANASDVMNLAFKEMGQIIGQFAAPVIASFTDILVTKVVPGVTAVADAFKEGGLSGAVGLIVDKFKEAGPGILSAIQGAFGAAANWIGTDGVKLFANFLAFLGNALVDWVIPALPGLLAKVGEVFARLVVFLNQTVLPLLVDKLIVLGDAFFGWITPMIPKLLNKLKDVAISIGNFVVKVAVPTLVAQAKKLGDALVGWISPLLRTLPSELIKFAVAIASFLLTVAVPKLVDAAVDLGKALLGWLPGLAVDLIIGLQTAFFTLLKALPGLFVDIGIAFLNLGKGAILLLVEGVKAGFSFLKGMAIEAVNVLIRVFNSIPLVPDIALITDQNKEAAASFGVLAKKAFGVSPAVGSAGEDLRLFNLKLGAVKTGADKATDAMSGLAEEVDGEGGKKKGGGKSVSEAAKQAEERLKAMAKGMEDAKTAAIDFGTKVGEALNKISPPEEGSGLNRAVLDLAEFKASLDGVKKAGPEFAEGFKQIADTLAERLVEGLDRAKERLDDAKQAFTNFATSVKTVITSTLNFQSAADKEGEGNGKSFIDALTLQAKRATEFGEQVRELVAMGLSREAIQQVLDAGQEAGTDIARELIDGGVGLINKTNELVAATNEAARKVGEEAAGAYFQAGIDNATSQIDGLKAQINTLTPELLAVMDTLAAKMKRQVKIDVKVSQKAFDVDVFVTKHVREMVSRQVVTVAGARAEGGPVQRSLAYLVGERGPEVFVPNQSGTILPNGAGPSGTTINLTVNAGIGTNGGEVGDAIVDALTRYQRRNGAIPVKVSG